ncbi:MAG TPA: carboxypeptidase-like regulatory domain-containing protein [Paludibaculum sp.]|jgi:hypothetical protein
MRNLLFLIPAVILAQADADVRKCTVAGTVVQETSGEPMRQVEIGLMPVREPKPGQPTPAAIGVYSDSNGQFRIPELEPGVYRVRLRKEGFSPTLPSGSIILPKLEPGQELADLKFTMAPQSVLAGRVLDDNGDPVANANVMLFRASAIRGRRTFGFGGGFANTDDRGLFHMAGIDPGRYVLAADEIDARDIVFPAGGGALTAYVTTYYPGVSDDSQAQVIEVQRGTVETGLEIRMRREPVFSVRGHALDSNGQPLPRFTVNARRSGAGQGMYLGGPPALFTNGEFALPGLRSGAWILTAFVINGTNTSSSAEIQVGSGPVEGIVLRPVPTQLIAGNAVLEGAGNIASDWTRIGISMAAADLQSGARVPATDPSGQFSMSFHGTGKAYLNVVGTPAPGTYLARVLLGADDVTGKELNVTAGGLPPLKLVFRPGAATLKGRAESADINVLAGRPAISLWPADPAQRDARATISGTFQPDGTFTITDIRPGEYLAYVGLGFEPGPYVQAEPPEDLEALSTRVRLEPGATQTIVVKLPRQRSAQ